VEKNKRDIQFQIPKKVFLAGGGGKAAAWAERFSKKTDEGQAAES